VLLFDSTRRNASPHIKQLCRLRHFMLYCSLMSWTHIIIFFMNEASACRHLHHICWLRAIFAGLLSGLCGCGCCTACSSSQNSLELSDLRGVPCAAVVFHPLTHMPVTLYCCHGSCPPLLDSRPLACDLLHFFTLNTIKTNKVLGLILLSAVWVIVIPWRTVISCPSCTVLYCVSSVELHIWKFWCQNF
jgi:hypothetical protein